MAKLASPLITIWRQMRGVVSTSSTFNVNKVEDEFLRVVATALP